MLDRDGARMDGHGVRVCCNLTCYSDCSLLPVYTLLAPALVSSAAMVPVGCVPSMSRLALSRLYLFCMVIRITSIKYGAGYSGTKSVLSRCIGTLRVSISGFFDTDSST